MELIFSQIPQQRNSATAQQRNSATAQQRNSATAQQRNSATAQSGRQAPRLPQHSVFGGQVPIELSPVTGAPPIPAFLCLSRRGERSKRHFYRSPGKNRPANGVFFVVPEKTGRQTAFFSLSRKKQAGKRRFFRCPGKNKAPNGVCIVVPVGRRLQMPFFTLSPWQQEKKWHFLGCSRQERPANGIFYVLPGGIPEKTPQNGSFPLATLKMRLFYHARPRNAPLRGQTPTVWDARTPVWPPIAVTHHQSPEPNPTERNTSHGFKSTSR